jgi:nicotinamide riboside kinase
MAKTVKLITGGTYNSKSVLVEVLSLPVQGCNIADMRKRMRVMDAIEKAEGDDVTLEDADYELLKGVFHANQFRLVHKDLLAIADTLA